MEYRGIRLHDAAVIMAFAKLYDNEYYPEESEVLECAWHIQNEFSDKRYVKLVQGRLLDSFKAIMQDLLYTPE